MSLIDALVRRPSLRQRNDTAFVGLRSWPVAGRDDALAAFKREKLAKTDVITAAAAEIADEARRLFAPGAGWSVTNIACGHSRDPRCWGKLLAEAVAAELGLPFVEEFRDRFVCGVSHTKEFSNLPPLEWNNQLASGSVLLVDDLATSGWHLEEALTLLRGRGLAASAIVWIAGTVQDGERLARRVPDAWPEWVNELATVDQLPGVATYEEFLDELGPLATG